MQTAALPLAASDPAHLLHVENFVARFAPQDIRNRCVRSLQSLLVRLDEKAPLAVTAEWLEDLSGWLFALGRVPGQVKGEPRQLTRLRLLLDALEAMPDQRARLRGMVAGVVATTHAVRLFTDTGLPSKGGFFSEFFERLGRNVLPPPPVGDDLAVLLTRVVHDQRTAAFLVALPEQFQQRLFRMLWGEGAANAPLFAAMRDAALLISHRVSVHGLADDVRRRSGGDALEGSPFLALPRVVAALLNGVPQVDGKDSAAACREALAACRRATWEVYGSLEQTGVSVDLVFRLDLIRRKLERLSTLLLFLSPPEGVPLDGSRLRFISALLKGGVADRSLREHLRQNVRLLARRVITRAGHGGEHYITRTTAEWHQMVSSAAGGGALVPLAALMKFYVTWAGFPLFIEGVFNSVNYAFAFVAMQLLHLTLATKQPAMTAAALAGALKEGEGGEEADMGELAELVARTTRSQIAAFLGNLGLVVPVVVAADLLSVWATGHHAINAATALKVVKNHHPLLSGTVVYAAFTGFFLWASSVVAGTVENWFVYRQLTESIATHRGLRTLVGAARAQRAATWLRDNVSAFAGNIGLAFMLGLVPAFATFFGLPIEVRHVTFVTSQVVYAGMQMGPFEVLRGPYLLAASSIGIVLLVNFASSFALALLVALRAREVDRKGIANLVRAVWHHFRKHPWDFVRPPKEPPPAAPAPQAATG